MAHTWTVEQQIFVDIEVAKETERCAKIADDYAEWLNMEAHNGGDPSLRDRANGVLHVAKKIRSLNSDNEDTGK